MTFKRPQYYTLLKRIKEPRRYIQAIAGPRQVGKTTIAASLLNELEGIAEYHSADDTSSYGAIWIDQVWESLRARLKIEKKHSAILILDEIQKIQDWSATVKKHWDRDTLENQDIKLVLLGSSRLLMTDGLSESLMGRFELIYTGHWGLGEMQKAFGFSVEQYQWFGGYPGAAAFTGDENRFKEYVRSSIIEPTLVRDVMMTTKIDKPALLRQLLEVGLEYSSQIISFNRLLGQLQDAGNTTTLSKYLRLLEQAGFLSGLNKYSKRIIETKGTIPKFQVHNTALLSATKRAGFRETYMNPSEWGRIVESSVGTYLIEQVSKNANMSLHYWREGNCEIDYVVSIGRQVVGIEVKSGEAGLSEKTAVRFKESFPGSKLLLVGKNGIAYETFMETELSDIV